MSTPQVTPTLAQSIRSKFPGQYDDMDDVSLEQKVLAKYPQYSDMPQTQPKPTQGVPVGQITAQHEPTSLGGKIENLWNKAGNDVRYGTQQTPIGSFLHMIGAQPTQNGVSEGTSEFMASPILGTAKASQGVGQLMQPGKRMQGAGNVASGLLQASQIPGGLANPLEGEAAANVAGKVAGKAAGLIPSTERAGQDFQKVMGVAKNLPVNATSDLTSAIDRYKQLVANGNSRSLAVSKLINRVQSGAALTYEDARDFEQSLGNLSANEAQRLKPVMKRQLDTIRMALRGAVQNTVQPAGVGDLYNSAMSEYAQGSRLNKALGDAGDYLKKQATDALPWLGKAYIVKKAGDALGLWPSQDRR